MNEQLKVVQTPVRYAPFVGGVEKYVQELSEAMAEQGADVRVICANEPTSPQQEVLNGVHVQRLHYKGRLANTNLTFGLLPALLKQDADIYHTHIPTPWSADLSALASLIKRKPLVVTYHNDLVKGGGLEALIAKTYNATLLKLLFAKASKIIITQPRYLEFSPHLQRFKDKVVTVPLGVSVPRRTTVQRDPNQISILTVLDRHHEYKGVDVLLQALAEVRKHNPKAHLKVGGKGELIEKYRKQAQDLGIDDAVEFLGFVTDEELADLYASSAVFALPSINNLEGFGIVALEALSYGTPVVTTDITGSAPFVEKFKAGRIVKPKDAEGLALALGTMLRDPQGSQAMGARGREAVNAQFSWRAIAQDMMQLYRECQS